MKQYLDSVRHVHDSIAIRGDRTGTGTQSVFGYQMRFDLNAGFPLTTTKKTFWKGILRELLWILQGSSDNTVLNKMGCNIWDKWATETGELGPVYGVQWRRWLTHRWVEETQPRSFGALWQEAVDKKQFGLANRLGSIAQEMAAKDLPLTQFNPPPASPIGSSLEAAGIPLTETVSYLKEERIDQIAELIENLRIRPFSRRHVVSAWNPADIGDESIDPVELARSGKMALAACHCLFQFYVDRVPVKTLRAKLTEEQNAALTAYYESLGDFEQNTSWKESIIYNEKIYEFVEQQLGVRTKRLSCQLYQRSCDLMVGVPFNIASYALLTHMVAQQCGLEVGEFIWTGGDCHIYSDHIEQVELQISRKPFMYPELQILRRPESIFDYQLDDFKVVGYEHHPHIAGKVSK